MPDADPAQTAGAFDRLSILVARGAVQKGGVLSHGEIEGLAAGLLAGSDAGIQDGAVTPIGDTTGSLAADTQAETSMARRRGQGGIESAALQSDAPAPDVAALLQTTHLQRAYDREWAALTDDEKAYFDETERAENEKRSNASEPSSTDEPAFDKKKVIHDYLYDNNRLPGQVTPEELGAIMPNSGDTADRMARPISDAMSRYGIIEPEQQAAFLAQVSVESGQLRRLTENLNYSTARMMQVWPGRFPTVESARPYARNPEALANRVYADRLGNGDEESGDGFRYRGRGLLQITGRDHYREQGFEDNPDALADPVVAADSAARHWSEAGLNERSMGELNRTQFTGIVRTVNGGTIGLAERWQFYQRALPVLRGR